MTRSSRSTASVLSDAMSRSLIHRTLAGRCLAADRRTSSLGSVTAVRPKAESCSKADCGQVRAEHMANQAQQRGVQDARKAALKNFIARFGQGHKKMAKQVMGIIIIIIKMAKQVTRLIAENHARL